ncbi:5'/3'-nucleotidase SurE [Magnetospira sp. QH-2]|uniref:5'/3'-nucleotidase SurE n=1 Tax=Magnetospira sp. (strain QH-2) TaxID=1288970 RepID=UPI0003E81974|nr:5'/3'-nucleotidase SurE [Magnetospira sp. QH-2]CCQ73510.1 5'-nucleotidase surE (Nucleoside 5'-monophosphate phosphohydrolase)(survival protein, protein damage control) [Magnetospira sp. QH-2]
MFDAPLDLKAARVLVTNDDGIDAPGMQVLEWVAATVAREVWVVAPEQEQSGAGHSLTLRRPLRIREVSTRRYAVDGTPTDCVMLAVKHLMKSQRPDLVLSGVNRGANMGEDVTYSGTIAAAMEGTLLGIPSIALSLHTEDRGLPQWETVKTLAPGVIQQVMQLHWPRNCLLNINFPDRTAAEALDTEITTEGRRKIGDAIQQGTDPRGEKYFWIGAQRDEDRFAQGTDLEAIYRGAVSVTPLSLDLTDRVMLDRLKGYFS